MYVMYVTTTAHPCPSWQPMLPDSPVNDGARPIPACQRLKFSQSSTPQLFAGGVLQLRIKRTDDCTVPFLQHRHPRSQDPTLCTYRQYTAAVLMNTI